MKKILMAVVFAAGIMAGCQKTDIYYESGVQMKFHANMAKQTKASGTPSAKNDEREANLKAQNFRVWAFQNWDDPLTETDEVNGYYDKIQNLMVDYKPATDSQLETWDPGKDYYWPGKDRSLKFYAISSANWITKEGASGAETVSITHSPANSKELGTMTISNFKVAPAADNDLMVADACIQMQLGSTQKNGVVVENAVSQTFRHALTKVRFSFKATTDQIPVFVQKIETNSLFNAGNLTVTFEDEIDFEWDRGTTAPFTDDYERPIDFAAKNVTHVWEDGATDNKTAVADLADMHGITLNDETYTNLDSWLMIPQPLEHKTVTITYILKDRQFKRTFPLDIEDDLESWEPNQFVTYKVDIAPNMIEFSASVEGWSEENVNINDSASE